MMKVGLCQKMEPLTAWFLPENSRKWKSNSNCLVFRGQKSVTHIIASLMVLWIKLYHEFWIMGVG